jgi:hypothetical protein
MQSSWFVSEHDFTRVARELYQIGKDVRTVCERGAPASNDKAHFLGV